MASKHIYNTCKLILKRNTLNHSTNKLICCKYSSYIKSPKADDFTPSINDYEISKCKREWSFVERILPPLTVPCPVPRETYSTEWRPASGRASDLEYCVSRNRNHQLPVYLAASHRGMRKLTEVHKVSGDIHQLERELLQLLQSATARPVASQLNELVGTLTFKGDHVQIIKQYLLDKGF